MSKYIKLEDAIEQAKRGTNNYYICKAIESLPTIEVNEDCISRADLIESFLADNECKREEAKSCMCSLDFMLELIEDAPSVVSDFKTFCGVPIEEAIDVLEKYKAERR